jgi:ABC-type nickel/cobalt efflux system permease component RcnA
VTRLAAAAGIILALAATAPAHDIPDARIDRAIQVVLRPGRVQVAYEVSLAELTLVRDYRSLFGPLPTADRRGLFEEYGRRIGPLDARGLLLTIDERPVELAYTGHDLAIEEHPRYTFHFVASIPGRGRLALRDTNYASSEGTSRLALRAEGVRLDDYDGPADVDAVPVRPLWQLSDEEERRTREVRVAYEPTASASVALAPEGPEVRPATTAPGRPGLSRLLEGTRRMSLLALVLAAFVLGAAHAVQPGHGKALVAAATLGAGGGRGRGVLLAGVVTAAHMASVLALALVLGLTRSAHYQVLDASLAAAAGFAIAAVGAWRLGRHLAGFPEHGDGAPGVGREGSLVGLGLAGGVVPCWDAILLVLLAETMGRLGLGLVLLAAFSVGMGSVLVIVGLVAGKLRRRLAGSAAPRRWERRLGLLSGGLLMVLGATMLFR